MAKKKVIGTVASIATDAQQLVNALKPKADRGADLSKQELALIARLVKRAEEARSAASENAKQRRREQIEELEKLISSVELALGTPGLSTAARNDLKTLRRRRLAQVLRLQTREALDFGGILTPQQIQGINRVLAQAKQDVAKKKKAAAFLSTLMRVADLALGIVSKVGGAA